MLNLTKPTTLTPEDIAEFEGKSANKSRGKVQVFSYDSDEAPDALARFYVTKPNRQILMAMAETQAQSIERANDLLLNSSVLGGDVALLQDDDALYLGLLKDISELVETKKKK